MIVEAEVLIVSNDNILAAFEDREVRKQDIIGVGIYGAGPARVGVLTLSLRAMQSS